MKVCKYCGSEYGFYLTETVRRSLYFTADGEEDFSSVENTLYSGKVKRCALCHKKWIPIEMEE